MPLTDKSPMLRVRVRLDDGTYRYVGKQSPSYAIVDGSDKKWHTKFNPGVGYNWVPENLAKVWTNVLALKRLVGYARDTPEETFSRLEVVDQFGNTAPLDELCPPKV